MKRFLINISIVFVVLLGIMSLLDIWITHNLHHSKANVFQGMSDVFFDSTYYDVLIMGSSRGLFQYDTRVLDSILHVKSYNAGINGRGIISQIIKYRVYEKRHGVPKVIIQNIDCFLLAEDNGFEREQYLPYFFDKEMFEMVKKREGFSELERFIPLIRYAGYEQVIKEGLGLSNKLPKSKLYNGYSPSSASWDGTKLEKTKEVGFSKDLEAVVGFCKYLRECHDKGVIVVLCYAPLYSGARNKMSSENQKAMFDTFDSIAKNNSIPVVSWWNSSISEDTVFFYNATHLNVIGAKLFTKELAFVLDSLDLFGCESLE